MIRWLKKSNPHMRSFPAPMPGLPDPNQMPTLDDAVRCAAVNQTIMETVPLYQSGPKPTSKRGAYGAYTAEQRLKIAKYAVANGATRAARHFAVEFKRPMNESTVRSMVKKFRQQMRDSDDPDAITALPVAKRGRPTLLGDDLDSQVLSHIRYIREAGGVVNRNILVSVALGIVSHHDRSLLKENGGSIDLSRGWVNSIFARLGYTKRKGTKAARKLPTNFPELRQEFLTRVSDVVERHHIPPEMIINFDQTGVSIVPTSNWTMAEEGSKQVDIIGLDDKRQVTLVLANTLAGSTLPPQVVYTGKTSACHPSFTFPSDWDITHSENHWSNATTMMRYADQVLIPYIDSKRDELDLPLRQRALVIMDVFKAHRVSEFLDKLKSAGCEVVFVPGGCTGELQPLDVSGNGTFKTALKDKFCGWYAAQVTESLEKGQTFPKIDLKLSTLKPLHAQWILHAVDKLASSPQATLTGWKKTGIQDAILYGPPAPEAAIDLTPEEPAEPSHESSVVCPVPCPVSPVHDATPTCDDELISDETFVTRL